MLSHPDEWALWAKDKRMAMLKDSHKRKGKPRKVPRRKDKRFLIRENPDALRARLELALEKARHESAWLDVKTRRLLLEFCVFLEKEVLNRDLDDPFFTGEPKIFEKLKRAK